MVMTSPIINQFIPLFVLLGLATILGLCYFMDGLARLLPGHSQWLANQPTCFPQSDEEAGKKNPRTRSWISLATLPHSRSSLTEPLIPKTVPSAYLPRPRFGKSYTEVRPRPIANLPYLHHKHPHPIVAQQQLPQQSLSFVLTNDSTETFEMGGSLSPKPSSSPATSMPNHSTTSLDGVALLLKKSPVPTRIPVANDSAHQFETAMAESSHLACTVVDFQAPISACSRKGSFPSRRPRRMVLPANIRTGTVRAQEPVIVSRHSSEPDPAAGNFVSAIVETMETATLPTISAECDQGKSASDPLLNSVLSRISNVREQWSRKDI